MSKAERTGDFHRMHWKNSESIRRSVARKVAAIPQGAKVVRLLSRYRQDVEYILSRDTYPAELQYGGGWRATRFDAIGPSGHFNAGSLEELLRTLSGDWVSGIGCPHAGASELFVHSAR